MLFMKGSPEAPQCGFSRTLVRILKEEGIQFKSFDILEDPEVRRELKDLSNWPTYPQVKAKPADRSVPYAAGMGNNFWAALF